MLRILRTSLSVATLISIVALGLSGCVVQPIRGDAYRHGPYHEHSYYGHHHEGHGYRQYDDDDRWGHGDDR